MSGTGKVDSLEITGLIGNTPLYKLPIETGGAEVWVKLEGGNPGGSVKDRTALGMLRAAERSGALAGRTTLVEPTSGNTGISLALIGGALGLRVVLTMPESMSAERRAMLRVFGAELILTPASEGMSGANLAAKQLLNSLEGVIMLDQFSHPGNPAIHEETTGPEILRGLPEGKKLAAFVAGFGTGGTICGTGRALKKKFPEAEIIAVEPVSSPLLTSGRAGAHKIQGIGANFVPKNLNRKEITKFMTVTDENAIETAKRLTREQGLFCGISTGANVWAAFKVAAKLPKNLAVVTIQPDRGTNTSVSSRSRMVCARWAGNRRKPLRA